MATSLLTSTQISSYNQDGYLVLPDFYSADEISLVMASMAAMVEAFDPTEAATVFSTTDHLHAQDEYFTTSGDSVRFFFEDGALDEHGQLTVPKHHALNKAGHAMHDLDPAFDAFSRHPKLAQVVADLGFQKPELLQSMYIFKPPTIGGEVTWHTDHTFLWTEPQSVVGFWVALEDATVDNGCMWAVPGGHTLPVKSRFRKQGAGTTMEVFDDSPYNTDTAVPLEVPAGTLIALNGTLPHWSAPNTSNYSRHAYTLHVIDGAAEYPEDNWLQRPVGSAAGPLRGFA